jgi:dUTPase
MNKSGVASKKGLIKGAELIDADYSGELHLHLINVGDEVILLSPGEKIIQVMLVKTAYLDPVEVQETELWNQPTERGPNGFGSTGIH